MKEQITIEPSKMYPNWCKFYVPTIQNIFFAETLDYYIEQCDLEELIKQARISNYKIVKKFDGFIFHAADESTARQIESAINYQDRCRQHDESNRWMYSD